jgi:Protein of unknown function (DUF2905)
MDSRSIGLLIGVLGVLIVLLGVVVYYGALDWFGRLPGDIRYERGNTRVYFPLASMLLISIVLSLLLSLFRRLR